MRLGLYLFEVPSSLEILDFWESQLGWPIQFVSIYQAWGSPYRNFYAKELSRIHQTGRTALVTWEPWEFPNANKPPHDQPAFALRRILGGDYDDYIYRWACASKALGIPYLLRPMHEMNGDWYPWCGTVNSNDPEEYVRAWKHMHAIFRAAGATQVAWVWCPYAASFPKSNSNRVSAYYPGDSYVDWLALDGYNWGNSRTGSRWENFDEIFSSAYNIVTGLSDRPLLIAETASTELGGSKSLWIEAAFGGLKEFFPRVKGLVWFNVNKECDWQIDSSTEAFLAFRQAIKHWQKVSTPT